MMRSSFPYGLSMPSNATEPTTSSDKACSWFNFAAYLTSKSAGPCRVNKSGYATGMMLRDVFPDDGRKILLCGFGDELWIGDKRVREGRAAFASARIGHGFDGFTENFLRVIRVLLKRGHNLRSGDGFVIGMPAIVVGDHSDGAVTEFGLAGEFCFRDVGHADDVE